MERVQSCSALPLAKATFSGFQCTVPAFGSQTHRPVPARQSFRSRGIYRHVVNRRLSCATFKGSLCLGRSSCSQGKCEPGGVLRNGFVGSVNVKHSEVALREGLP